MAVNYQTLQKKTYRTLQKKNHQSVVKFSTILVAVHRYDGVTGDSPRSPAATDKQREEKSCSKNGRRHQPQSMMNDIEVTVGSL